MRRGGIVGGMATVLLASALGMAAQNLPPGTHSVDDPREDPGAVLLREAEAALEKQDYKAAEAALKPLAAKRPKDAQVLYDLGFAQEANGETSDAAASYAAAIAVDGTTPEPILALGLLEARSGHGEEARRDLERVAKMQAAPPELRARALRALARLDLTEHPGAARDALLAAIQLTGTAPGDDALTAQLADRAGTPETAETAYRRALAATPGDLDAVAGLAHALTQEQQYSEAEALLRPQLEKHPDDPRLVAQLAAVLSAEGKPEEAVPLVEALRAQSAGMAGDASLTRLLAQLYLVAGQAPKAEPLYRQLMAADPGDAELEDDLGTVLVKEQKYGEAETVLSRAAANRNAFASAAEWGEVAGHLAFAASRAGHPQVTLQALAARATVLADSPASLFLQATSYDTLHQYPQAVKSYKAFLAVANGKFPDEEFEARHRLVALKPGH